jgi:hypothetical protein
MPVIELTPTLRDTLKRLGEVEENALLIFVRGLKELLKECDEEILDFEIRYGSSFDQFNESLNDGRLGDPFSYPLEKDAMKWEDLMMEKKHLLNLVRELEQLK